MGSLLLSSLPPTYPSSLSRYANNEALQTFLNSRQRVPAISQVSSPWGAPKVAHAHVPHDVSARFGRRLRELRLLRKMTQSDMSRRFGIDRSFISDVERGRKSMTLPMLEVIALGMNLSLSQLFEDI